jgi:hypothetical protein
MLDQATRNRLFNLATVHAQCRALVPVNGFSSVTHLDGLNGSEWLLLLRLLLKERYRPLHS